MKVTFICDVLGEANNGTTLAAMNLINHLKDSGHQVTVVSPDKRRENGYISLDTFKLWPASKILENNGVYFAKPDEKILTDAIKDADVVHLLIPMPLSVASVKIARELGKPITASFHCQAENVTSHLGLMNSSSANHLIYEAFYQHVYRYCDAVHYPTQMIREIFENDVKHKTNAYIISNGVNDAFVPPVARAKNEKFTIVCSGRYSREKAQQQLIEAVAASKHKDDIHIILAGDGLRKKYLARRIKMLNVDAEMRFFSRSEMVNTLQSADLYVHTAIVEIEAIACMEAICCGLVPVICNSKRSATRFFAIGDNTLFEENNIADLTSKIDYWYEHPDKRLERFNDYSELRHGFSQKECMKRMEQMLLDTIANKQK